MISVKDLHKSFGGVTVLDGISTDIEKGDVVCIIGPSGSGKSTFLRCLNRLETPDSGKILLDGVDLTCLLYTSPSPRDRSVSRMPSSA